MSIIRVYMDANDITKAIQSKLGEQSEKFSDSQWFPIDIKLNDCDMTIDFTLAAVKKSSEEQI